MKIVRTVSELQKYISEAVAKNQTIGLVPTMGALHAGHLSLVDRARRENQVVVVSVFVNPTQFNNPADLETYPRTEEADMKLLQAAGVDIAFVPTAEEVYGDTPDTKQFDLGTVAEVMEGAMRPGHFNGVAQIVSRLFLWTRPTKAYFGKKDFQQIAVIRRMASTEGFTDIDIVACPIVRENDGLALSSRNVRLTPEMRKYAPTIYATLTESLEDRRQGKTVTEVIESVTKKLNSIPGVKVEYYSIVDPDTMLPVDNWNQVEHPVGCITVYFGDVRLIDNITY
ncbi:MAG: pantoate--beta-alanine ligase [Muribaculaceae bacterium]|nr:pantoate--beta-alanine ligase [Muribaculaceae bacterium]